MIEMIPFLGPFAKRLGENYADQLSTIGLWGRGQKSESELSAAKSEIEDLRAENDQLKTYIFLTLQILKKEMEKTAKKDEENAG